MKSRAVLAAIAVASGVAAADVKKVALQGEQTPLAGVAYKKFGYPVVSDTPGAHVAVYDRSRGGKRCIFTLDPAGGPGTTVACEKDMSTDAGRRFQRFGPPTIDAAADVSWGARIAFGRNGIFRSGPATVALVGDPVPTPGTGLLDKLSLANITDAGDVVFEATISGGTADQGLFRCTGGDGNCSSGGTGTLVTLLLAGDPVPDRPGREFCVFEELAASSWGIAFRAATQLDCTDNGESPLDGVFRQPFGGPAVTVALVSNAAEPFPSPGGTTYADFVGSPAIENGGAVAFVADSGGAGATSAVYRCDPVPCPAAPASALLILGDFDGSGNAFRGFGPPAIDSARDVAFMARLSGGPGGTFNGLYLRPQAGGVQTIAKTGDTVPGLNPPAIFRLLVTPPAMSPGGKIAFKSRIRRSVAPRNAEGIFVAESPSGAFLDDALR